MVEKPIQLVILPKGSAGARIDSESQDAAKIRTDLSHLRTLRLLFSSNPTDRGSHLPDCGGEVAIRHREWHHLRQDGAESDVRMLLLASKHWDKALRATLEGHRGFHIIAEATNTEEALSLAELTQPDIILIDLAIGSGASGIEAVRTIKQYFADVRVMVASWEDDEKTAISVLRSGGEAYVNKLDLSGSIIDVVYTVLRGQIVISPAITRHLTAQSMGMFRVYTNLDRLSQREREIVSFLRKGMTSRAIAQQLSLSVRTVQNHRVRILRKLQAKNIAEAIAFATQQALLPEAGPSSPRPSGGENSAAS